MKHLLTGLTALTLGSSCLAQPDCWQIIQTSFTYTAQGNVVVLTNTSQSMFPQATTYQWVYGDGEVGPASAVTHVYDAPGTYLLCLYAVVENCVDTACQEIVVGGGNPCSGLQAGFSASVSGNAAQFSNGTTGTGFQTNWYWDFGDGGASDNAQPQHTYNEPGTYLVCLTAMSVYEQNGGGLLTCADTICHEVVISNEPSPCDSLSAGFWTGSNGGGPLSIVFSASNPGGTGTHWLWSFGDGTYSDDGPQGTHNYNEPGTYEICLTTWAWVPGTQDTCSATSCQSILVGDSSPCDSVFACFQWGQQNEAVQFYNCSSNGELGYWWSFGDGTNSDGYQPSHTYPGPGTYTVCLTVWATGSEGTCSDTICNTLVVQSDGSPCDSLSADFVVTTQENLAAFSAFGGTAIGYHWNFGDGTSGDGPAPTHTYPGPGTYHACLITWTWDPQTQDTCYADHCSWITIGGGSPCDSSYACFQWGLQNTVAQFFNCSSSNGQVLNYWWSFGDGTSGDGYQPVHTYPGPGSYTVCLTVYTDNSPDSCSHTICDTLVIQDDGSPCDSLSAEFSVTGIETQAVFTSFGGTAIGYHWTFGDGTEGDGVNPVHVYPGPGSYHACLVTWTWDPQTQDTCYADHCEWITIGGGGPCDSTFACFQWGLQNTVAQFFNCSSSNGQELNYWWSFGDGTSGDGYQPVHTYPGPGTYTVCLTVYTNNSPDSCSHTICNTLLIQGDGSPCDSLSAEFTVTGIETQAVFTNFGGTAIGYHWTFGDGTEGDGVNPVHVYPGPGSYHACLVTWTWDPQTQDTCYAEHCQWITIGGSEPCDSLQAGFVANVGDATVWFSNTTFGTGFQTTWHWDFGDGTTSNDAQPSHIFPGLDTYEVCLTVTTLFEQQGGGVITCEDSYCGLVSTGGGSPCDSLGAFFVVTTQENLAAFTTFGGTAIGYLWDFGDGTEGDGPAPTHTYPGPGAYHACLITWTWDPQTQDTCYADHCEWIIIGGGDPCDTIQSCFTWQGSGAVLFFDNCSSMNGMGPWYHWDFGDGTQSDAISPTHTFPGPGSYTVCLTGWLTNSPDSCTSTICHEVVVGGGDSPCDSLGAEFTVTGIETQAVFTSFGGTAIGYHWTFGDGTQGDGVNPVHVYPGPGSYHACLVTWTWDPQTQDTCYAEHCEWITIGGGGPCDSLEAHFVWEPAGPNVFLFQDASWTNGQDVSYWWSFGDGTNADGPNPDHLYQQPGEYTVCLTITALNSPDSCSSTTCQTIIVQGGGSPCDTLNAEFMYDLNGSLIVMHAAANPPGTSYQWMIDGDLVGDGVNAEHILPGPGVYNVCLIVGAYDPVAEDSCFEDHCQFVTVGGGSPCDSLWTADFEYGHQGTVYTFYNTSDTQGDEVSTHWDFGDGTTSDDSQVVHTYAASGEYTVCMTITGIAPGTNDTCEVTTCQEIQVVTGIEDVAGGSSLIAWPQPFDDVLLLEGVALQGPVRFSLFDMTGRMIHDQRSGAQGRVVLHYDHLPTGAYVLRVRNEVMDRSIRVVKR